MHTFWLRLRDPPGGTSTFDSQRPSTTYFVKYNLCSEKIYTYTRSASTFRACSTLQASLSALFTSLLQM
ncbi:unnamed protein product [Acanthoscelides obtectus]|uniref:Uncharacterized protein n=1 Tax=Acanthoscelides obtectus TaxID=200917 RepID=A0A9P0LGB0_ACAOB|nr:unnamed protein product [Acanthoscelides obtectus]CAK1621464.1 hypothetical protein AOBTE_LOCUS975 [Acanthoscelides obtectus]